MDSKGQLGVFCLCVAIGFVGGVLYEIFILLRMIFRCDKGKNKVVGIAIDMAFFVAFGVLCIYGAYRFYFPNLRFYMWIGYAIGYIIYLKTLRRILAFLEKVCYNKASKVAKKVKTKKKLSMTGDKI